MISILSYASMISSALLGLRKLGNRKEKISLLQEVTLHTVVSLAFHASVAVFGFLAHGTHCVCLCRHAPCWFISAHVRGKTTPFLLACLWIFSLKSPRSVGTLSNRFVQRAHNESKMATSQSFLYSCTPKCFLSLPSTIAFVQWFSLGDNDSFDEFRGRPVRTITLKHWQVRNSWHKAFVPITTRLQTQVY